MLKAHVADGQNFVEDQDLGIDFDGHGEGQTHIHSGGILLDGSVDEFADIGEVDDGLLALQHVAFGVAHQQAVEQDVLPAREFVMESRAQFDQRRQRAIDGDRTFGRPVDAGDNFQQRALARSIASNDADGLPMGYVKRYILDRLEIVIAGAVRKSLENNSRTVSGRSWMTRKRWVTFSRRITGSLKGIAAQT